MSFLLYYVTFGWYGNPIVLATDGSICSTLAPQAPLIDIPLLRLRTRRSLVRDTEHKREYKYTISEESLQQVKENLVTPPIVHIVCEEPLNEAQQKLRELKSTALKHNATTAIPIESTDDFLRKEIITHRWTAHF